MEEQSSPRVSLAEGAIILIVMLLIMGVSVIKLALAPEIPILLVIFLLICWAKARKISWSSVNDGIVNGIQTGIIPIFIFIFNWNPN
ncbi:predicted tyrosine transporter, NhaC family [Lentilactobacillus kosonis]|uniref:Predicted tyrosine transporter, NhaC family n=1 Tax=Lentilactobacillus kosonis TaxID=2810561 RepID=A0A401FIC3_9LACO|nr:predicted tyrosine transporter, NhaC family [Lentilactobacillus kosonis]